MWLDAELLLLRGVGIVVRIELNVHVIKARSIPGFYVIKSGNQFGGSFTENNVDIFTNHHPRAY